MLVAVVVAPWTPVPKQRSMAAKITPTNNVATAEWFDMLVILLGIARFRGASPAGPISRGGCRDVGMDWKRRGW